MTVEKMKTGFVERIGGTIFQQLFYLADHKYGGRLPVHVHFLMDEFANVSLPDDFDKILSVMRSREVSVSIILQNLAQLKALFEIIRSGVSGGSNRGACLHYIFIGSKDRLSKIQIKTQEPKKLYDKCGQWKYSGRRPSDKTSEAEMDLYEKTS